MRAFAAVLIVFVSSPLGAVKKKRSCVAVNSTKVQNATAAAAKATDAAFAKAMKKAGLTRAALGRKVVTLHEGIRDHDGKGRPHKLGEEFTGEIEGTKGRWIAGPSYWTGAAGAPAELELVTDASGDLYLLERIVTGADVTRIAVCQCQPFRCGSGCPACHSTVQVYYGPLPDNVSFKGKISVSYRAKAVTLDYAGQCRANCPP
jgi:hypothetical protein